MQRSNKRKFSTDTATSVDDPGAVRFSPQAAFLRGLKRNNRREWFEARRPVYERELKAPALALIEQVSEAMEEFAPGHVRPSHKCLMRIYRDTRFSTDKRPYKTQVAAWWGLAGAEKTSGAGYYFHLSASELVIAAGCFMPAREQMLAIRTTLLDQHEELGRLLADPKLRAVLAPGDARPLARMPKGFSADHPAAEVVRWQRWGIAATLPAEAALSPTLVSEILVRFRRASRFVDFLNRASGYGVAAPAAVARTARRKVLFPLP